MAILFPAKDGHKRGEFLVVQSFYEVEHVIQGLFLVVSLAAQQAAGVPAPDTPRPDRVELDVSADPAYQAIAPSCGKRTAPDAATRLVVVRMGRCVLDRGLRDVRTEVAPRAGENRRSGEEQGFSEEAHVAPDGTGAVLVTSRYRLKIDPRLEDTGRPTEVTGASVVTWIDPTHPDGRWNHSLEAGRWVREAVPIAGGQGLALSTFGDPSGPADFALYGADGALLHRMDELQASCLDIMATRNGAFLVVDVAYPSRRGYADRGLVVFDLLRGSRWTYAWSYGGDGEPVAWRLEETGVLRVEMPEAIVEYDRNGKLLERIKTRSRRP